MSQPTTADNRRQRARQKWRKQMEELAVPDVSSSIQSATGNPETSNICTRMAQAFEKPSGDPS